MASGPWVRSRSAAKTHGCAGVSLLPAPPIALIAAASSDSLRFGQKNRSVPIQPRGLASTWAEARPRRSVLRGAHTRRRSWSPRPRLAQGCNVASSRRQRPSKPLRTAVTNMPRRSVDAWVSDRRVGDHEQLVEPLIAQVEAWPGPASERHQPCMACSGPHPPFRHAFGRGERGAGKRPRCEDTEHPVRRPRDWLPGAGPHLDRVDAAKSRRRQASTPDLAREAKRAPSERGASRRRGAGEPHLEPTARESAHGHRGRPAETNDGRIRDNDWSSGGPEARRSTLPSGRPAIAPAAQASAATPTIVVPIMLLMTPPLRSFRWCDTRRSKHR